MAFGRNTRNLGNDPSYPAREHRDTQAIHAKLDELLKAVGDADADLMDVDKKDAEEVEQERAHVQAS